MICRLVGHRYGIFGYGRNYLQKAYKLVHNNTNTLILYNSYSSISEDNPFDSPLPDLEIEVKLKKIDFQNSIKTSYNPLLSKRVWTIPTKNKSGVSFRFHDVEKYIQHIFRKHSLDSKKIPIGIYNEIVRISNSRVLRDTTRLYLIESLIDVNKHDDDNGKTFHNLMKSVYLALKDGASSSLLTKSRMDQLKNNPLIEQQELTPEDKETFLLTMSKIKLNSCSGCGAALHQDNNNLPGFVGPSYVNSFLNKLNRLEEIGHKQTLTEGDKKLLQNGQPELICHRCYFMRHENKELIQFNSPEINHVMQAVKSLSLNAKKKAIIYHVVSANNFPSTLDFDLLRHYAYNDRDDYKVCLVFNKMDIRPKYVTIDEHLNYLKNILWTFLDVPSNYLDRKRSILPITKDGNYSLESTALKNNIYRKTMTLLRDKLDIFHTCATDDHVKALADNIRKQRLLGYDIFLVGYTNVGKSSLINSIGRLHGISRASLPVVMPTAGTTVSPLKVNMPLTRTISDKDLMKKIELKNGNKPKSISIIEQVVNVTDEFEKKDKESLIDSSKHDSEKDQLSSQIRKEFKMQHVDDDPIIDSPDFKSDIKPGNFYDMPGWKLDNNLVEYLPMQALNTFVPKDKLSSQSIIVRPGESLFILGLLRIDVTPLTTTKMNEEVEAILEKIPDDKKNTESKLAKLKEMLEKAVLTKKAVTFYFNGSGIIKLWKCKTDDISLMNTFKSSFQQLASGSECMVYPDGTMNNDKHLSLIKKNNKIKASSVLNLLVKEQLAITNFSNILSVSKCLAPLFEYKLPQPEVNISSSVQYKEPTGHFFGEDTGLEIHLADLGHIVIPMQLSDATIVVHGPRLNGINVSELETSDIHSTSTESLDSLFKPNSKQTSTLQIHRAYGLIVPQTLEGTFITIRPPIPTTSKKQVSVANPPSIQALKQLRKQFRSTSKAKKTSSPSSDKSTILNKSNSTDKSQHLDKRPVSISKWTVPKM